MKARSLQPSEKIRREVTIEIIDESGLGALPPELRQRKIADMKEAAQFEESSYQAELEHDITVAYRLLAELKGDVYAGGFIKSL